MPVSRDMVGVKGDECDCGRRLTVRHCISCGSTRLYARQQRYHTMLDGSIKLFDIEFRCQGCGHLFVEEERQYCEAPPVGQTLAKLKVQRLAESLGRSEYLRPGDQKLADVLDKIQGKKTNQKVDDIHELEKHVAPEAVEEVNAMPHVEPDDFVPPNGLTRPEFDYADRAFRLEWAQKKLMGQDPGISAEEYVRRRLKGELFE